MHSRPFGFLSTGESVEAYTLSGTAGASVEILNYGGIVASLLVPDRGGRLADVVLGFDKLAAYELDKHYFGATVGRIAGRVTGGRIDVDRQLLQLPLNDSVNHAHGGFTGLNRRLWRGDILSRADGADSLRLSYHSPEGEENYPGNVDLSVTYTFTAENTLVIESEVQTDRVTPVCLTHHSYFNLAGEGSGTIFDHVLQIEANEFVPIDDTFTLLDYRAAVDVALGNDFRKPVRLGAAIPLLYQAHGALYPLRASPELVPNKIAGLTDFASGRRLEVSTTETCLQVYTGTGLDGSIPGKSGGGYGPFTGLCLECQGYPNATTASGFGDLLVRPGKPQRRITLYSFSVC